MLQEIDATLSAFHNNIPPIIPEPDAPIPVIPSIVGRDLSLHHPWKKAGWTAVGVVGAVGTGVLIFVPVDGVAGDIAAGAGTAAAFNNAAAYGTLVFTSMSFSL